MVVGILRLRLMIPGAHSLKEKRQALRSIKDRLRGQYNVSVAEVGSQDLWQMAELGVSAVGTDRAFAESVLDSVVRLARQSRQVSLAGAEKEFVQGG